MALISVEQFTPSTNLADLNRATTEEVEMVSPSEQPNHQHENQPKTSCEYYIMVRGADIIFPHNECQWFAKSSHKRVLNDIEKHLQAILQLLRPCDVMKMAVKLESLVSSHRTRYLLVVSNGTDESCLLGVDYENGASIGLVLPFWNDMEITLDGDGGFRISNAKRHHIFKPVSVQAMWSAFQALHLAKKKAIKNNYYQNGGSHRWVEDYQICIKSNRKCLQEWHTITELDDVERNQLYEQENKPEEQKNFEEYLFSKLKDIMISVDLEQVTSKEIRNQLEQIVERDLTEYKSFIDNQMIRIMGQLEEPSKILDYLYLGSEWNASNYEELRDKKVKKILNVTCEIENFFPGLFDYYNIRVLDDDSTDMLRYLNDTYVYIRKAKDDGEVVLVHCKKGISRSASVVVAYLMKEKNLNVYQALEYVRNHRKIIRPNSEFLKQLEIYQGMLDASNKKSSMWKSNSESDLKEMVAKKSKSKGYSTNRLKIIKPEVLEQNDENDELQKQRRRSWPPKNSSGAEYLIFKSDKEFNEKPIFAVDQENGSRVKEKIEGFENNRYPCNQNKKSKKNFTKNGVVSNLTYQFEAKDKVLLKDLSNLEVKSSKPPLPKAMRSKPTEALLSFDCKPIKPSYSSCDNISIDYYCESIDKLSIEEVAATRAISKSSSDLSKLMSEEKQKKQRMNNYYDILLCPQNSMQNVPLDLQCLRSFLNGPNFEHFEGLVKRRTEELEVLYNQKELRNTVNKSNSMPSSPNLREHLKKQCQAKNNKGYKSNITSSQSQSYSSKPTTFSTVSSGDTSEMNINQQTSRVAPPTTTPNNPNDEMRGNNNRRKKTYGKTHPLRMIGKGNAL